MADPVVSLIQQYGCNSSGACKSYNKRVTQKAINGNPDKEVVTGRVDYQVFNYKPETESYLFGLFKKDVTQSTQSFTTCDIISTPDGQEYVDNCKSNVTLHKS